MPRVAFVLSMLVAVAFPGVPAVAIAGEATAETKVDVVVYGGTPAGIAAAIKAGEANRRVLLIEPYSQVGGLATNGLSNPDFRTFEGLSGVFLDFTRRVRDYYADQFGPESQQVADCLRGTRGEPRVNRLVFEAMLREQSTVRVERRARLVGCAVARRGGTSRIESATFADTEGRRFVVTARLFIDASYEGDLLAAAGVEYRTGREGRSQYGESLAPEVADTQVQGYNFRLVATQYPALRVMPTAPPGYDREEFLPVVALLESGAVESVFCQKTGGIYKAHLPALPNGKHDVNDVSRGAIRLSLPDLNNGWPDGDEQTRRRIFAQHLRHNVGLLYFLQNDEAVPSRFRDEASQWGWCRDEFVDGGHVPEQLYVREARRMVGQHVFTERDTEAAEGDPRAVRHASAVAIGDYGHNCHGTNHEGSRFGGKHTGEFYKRVPPYQIPYGVLVPRHCDNLLVPVACSASHVGFCALRLEPVWTSLGEAAGVAAGIALEKDLPVQRVPVTAVQWRLHAGGAASVYVADVLPDSADFAAVQWWGTQGGLHGLADGPFEPGQRGRHLVGQYHEAFPRHAAELDRPLDDALRQRWLQQAESLGVSTDALARAATRGDFIRRAYANRKHQ